MRKLVLTPLFERRHESAEVEDESLGLKYGDLYGLLLLLDNSVLLIIRKSSLVVVVPSRAPRPPPPRRPRPVLGTAEHEPASLSLAVPTRELSTAGARPVSLIRK